MSDLEVRTTAGVVRGVAVGNDLRAWRGIPYAASTAGEGRFRAPRPPQPWTGVRAASAFGPAAPQPLSRWAARRTTTSEDCLSLNVVTPATVGPPRPVMVWIHGGAYRNGSSAQPGYAGHRLVAAGDVVYVSINYRLGALGFLDLTRYATAERPIESNLGIRDQVAALTWVRANIAAFGGDPDNVTVFGESAGGTSVTTLLAVPAARGLFHRAIAQSPAPHAVYQASRTEDWGAQVVGLLGLDDKDAAAVVTADAATLVAAAATLENWVNEATPGTLCFAPVVDGAFLPTHPADAALAGTLHPVPLLIGTNDREATLFARTGSTLLPTTRARLDRMFALTDPTARERVLAAYPGRGAVIDAAGDHAFWWPSVGVAEGHAAAASTFMYRYDLAPRLLRLARVDATHAAEIMPVFGEVDGPFAGTLTALGGRAALRAASTRMQAHWIHFARHGTPAPGWPAYDAEHRRTLVIDETDRVEDDPRAERRQAWTGFTDYR